MSGWKSVAIKAIAIPPIATQFPFRAVVGEFIIFSATINPIAAKRYPTLTRSPRVARFMRPPDRSNPSYGSYESYMSYSPPRTSATSAPLRELPSPRAQSPKPKA